MRVAFLNRNREAYPGGDLVQIDNTIQSLAKYGVEAVYAPEGWTPKWLQTFDLAHIFHCNFGWSGYNFDRCLESKIPYVMTPIFYPSDELGNSYNNINYYLEKAERLFPFSYTEFTQIYSRCATLGTPITVVPNATEDVFFHTNYDVCIANHHKREGVLCVEARPGKNSERVAEACKTLDIPFTLVSGVESRSELAKIYSENKLFVNLSSSERMSLTIGEALTSGCRVLATTENWGNEHYPELMTISPQCTQEDLEERIQRCYYMGNSWSYKPNTAARSLTWNDVARTLKSCYATVLNGLKYAPETCPF